MLMNQGSERTEPRNHYTTAPLVITHVTYPYKRNQEHKQEQEMQSNKHGYKMGSHKPVNGDTI
jgi:hypothetical protein